MTMMWSKPRPQPQSQGQGQGLTSLGFRKLSSDRQTNRQTRPKYHAALRVVNKTSNKLYFFTQRNSVCVAHRRLLAAVCSPHSLSQRHRLAIAAFAARRVDICYRLRCRTEIFIGSNVFILGHISRKKWCNVNWDYSVYCVKISSQLRIQDKWTLANHSTLSRPRLKMQQGIRTLKQKCNAAIISLCPCQLWWSWVHAPWESEKALLVVTLLNNDIG